MPCNSDYMEPNQKEEKLQLTAKLYRFALSCLGLPIPKKVTEAENNHYCNVDFVPNLCKLIRGMTVKQLSEIVYDGRSPTSRQLADWWDEHQKADAVREKRKLKVDFTEADKPESQKKLEATIRWTNPVGWWVVDTEGDCEGRSVKQLGTHYGHIAEIAFSLANKSGYSLSFKPIQKTEKPQEITYIATRRKVDISFSIGPFSISYPDLEVFANWMDIQGVKVSKGTYNGTIHIEALP